MTNIDPNNTKPQRPPTAQGCGPALKKEKA